jgi:hypothetical protein
VLDKFAAVQMIDVHIPTTDGRELLLTRYTEPEKELNLLLAKLKLVLPEQPPPKITVSKPAPATPCSAELLSRPIRFQWVSYRLPRQSAKLGYVRRRPLCAGVD